MSVIELVRKLTAPLVNWRKEHASNLIRRKCSSCNRWLSPDDIVANACPYCLEARATDAIYKFRPFDNTKQQFPRCYECNAEIHLIGLKTWDVLAQSHKILCTACGEKQLEKDNQYRNTPWGYSQKLR